MEGGREGGMEGGRKGGRERKREEGGRDCVSLVHQYVKS